VFIPAGLGVDDGSNKLKKKTLQTRANEAKCEEGEESQKRERESQNKKNSKNFIPFQIIVKS
jgi:hypothetical protein